MDIHRSTHQCGIKKKCTQNANPAKWARTPTSCLLQLATWSQHSKSGWTFCPTRRSLPAQMCISGPTLMWSGEKKWGTRWETAVNNGASPNTHTASLSWASTPTRLQFASLLGRMLITSVTSRHSYPGMRFFFFLPTVVQTESLSSVLIKQLGCLGEKKNTRENSKLLFSLYWAQKILWMHFNRRYLLSSEKRRSRWKELTSK